MYMKLRKCSPKSDLGIFLGCDWYDFVKFHFCDTAGKRIIEKTIKIMCKIRVAHRFYLQFPMSCHTLSSSLLFLYILFFLR